MSALDTVVNVQFPSIMLPSFRIRLLLLTQSLISPPASACEERNYPMRILAGGCRPAYPLIRFGLWTELSFLCALPSGFGSSWMSSNKHCPSQKYCSESTVLRATLRCTSPSPTSPVTNSPLECLSGPVRHEETTPRLVAARRALRVDPWSEYLPLARGNHTFHHHNNNTEWLLTAEKDFARRCLFWSHGFFQNQ